MKIKEIMSKPAICVDESTPIKEVINIMKNKDLGFLPVTKDDYLVGVVTDRDILLRAKGKKNDTPIAKIMTKDNLQMVNMNDELEEAGIIMSRHKLRRLVVTDGEYVKGVITSKDLLRDETLIPYIRETYITTSY